MPSNKGPAGGAGLLGVVGQVWRKCFRDPGVAAAAHGIAPGEVEILQYWVYQVRSGFGNGGNFVRTFLETLRGFIEGVGGPGKIRGCGWASAPDSRVRAGLRRARSFFSRCHDDVRHLTLTKVW